MNSLLPDLRAKHSTEDKQTREHYESIINDIQVAASKSQEKILAKELGLQKQKHDAAVELVCRWFGFLTHTCRSAVDSVLLFSA